MINTQEASYTHQVNSILPGAKIIRCKGYFNNADYSTAKSPLGSYKNNPKSLTETEIRQHLSNRGWIGVLIPKDYIVIDVDDLSAAGKLYELLEGEKKHFHLIMTPNGMQFIFKATSAENQAIKMISKFFTSIGIIIDTRVGTTNSLIVFPTENTADRFISKVADRVDELPEYLRPIWNTSITKDYVFPVPVAEGSRNASIFELGSKVKRYGNASDELIQKSMQLVWKYFIESRDSFPVSELSNTIKSICSYKSESTLGKDNPSIPVKENSNIKLPEPYFQKNGHLYRKDLKGSGDSEKEGISFVSRHLPVISRQYEHVERNEVFYQLEWTTQHKTNKEIVSALKLASKRDLISLSDKGLAVNDLNARYFIDYFDLYLSMNDIPKQLITDRLGMVNETFIHPEITEGIKISVVDQGYKNLVSAMKTKGTLSGWEKEVLSLINDNPKALFLVVSSFASLVLEDLNIDPIIIDLSGSTSRGKSRVLSAAGSVWGNPRGFISEFNATLNSIERKAAFLSNYPLLIDDHNKAQFQILEKLVYNFSGGMSKGRATIQGIQEEYSWSNILICNGENSLLDYVERAGGASARVIALQDFKFQNKSSSFFLDLSKGMERNYGVAGLEFLKVWTRNKNKLIPQFETIQQHFIERAGSNEVLVRLATHYAAIIFVAEILRKQLKLKVNSKSLIALFDELAADTENFDKPTQLLREVLQDLDSDRNSIFYDEAPKYERKAVFREEQLFLLPKYLRTFLGVEMKQVRKSWIDKGFTYSLNNKKMSEDVKAIKHQKEVMQVVPVNPQIIEDMGYNFDQR